MGLADLADELQGKKPKKPIEQVDLEAELGGKAEEDGSIKLDVTDLEAIGARLREVRKKKATLKKEEDRLRTLVLGHPDSKVGFSNGSIIISSSQEMNTNSPELLAALEKTGTLDEAYNKSISPPKVREIAKREAEVAAAITTFTVRKVKIRK